MQASTEIEGCFMDGLFRCSRPQVKLIARRLAFEALKQVTTQVHRERAAFAACAWFMEGTLAAHLMAPSFHNDEAEQLQNFGHGDVGTRAIAPKVRPD